MRIRHSISISYVKAQRALKFILELIKKSPNGSYALLLSYLFALKKSEIYRFSKLILLYMVHHFFLIYTLVHHFYDFCYYLIQCYILLIFLYILSLINLCMISNIYIYSIFISLIIDQPINDDDRFQYVYFNIFLCVWRHQLRVLDYIVQLLMLMGPF